MLKHASHISWVQIENEIFVINEKNADLIVLTKESALLWLKIAENCSDRELVKEFNMDVDKINSILKKLYAYNLIEGNIKDEK